MPTEDRKDGRPDPDNLLAQVQQEELTRQRGRLKIFLGAAPGVGKTYAMLRYGQQELAKGTNVLVGIVETHQRAETQDLADVLPTLPRKHVPYKHVVLEEFDLDAALAFRPELLLLDELAHSNAPGSRHKKRWQDMDELLDAGLSVATTVNVQHLESVHEVVQQITGIKVQETLPDHIIQQADEVILIDISDEDLLQRLKEGKVYLGERSQRAMMHFFRKGNLIALRQLALRLVADRVDLELRQFHKQNSEDERRSGSRDRLLVAVSGRPEDEHLVRAAYHLATAQRAEWLVVHVDTPRGLLQRPQTQAWIWSHLHLAEGLGAETTRLTGVNIGAEIIAYAQLRDVTQIMLGQSPGLRKLFWWWPGSLTAHLLNSERNMDVVIHPLPTNKTISEDNHLRNQQYLGIMNTPMQRRTRNRSFVISGLLGFTLSGIAWSLGDYLGFAGIFMIYMLGAVGAALKYGRWPSLITFITSMFCYYSFGLDQGLPRTLGSLAYFALILSLILLISQLVASSREQELMARTRERRARNLYQLVQELSSAKGVEGVLNTSIEKLHQTLSIVVSFWLPPADNPKGPLQIFPSSSTLELEAPQRNLRAAARWSFLNKKYAGMGTNTLTELPALFIPMLSGQRVLGVMMLSDLELHQAPTDWLRYLDTVARLVAVALDSALASNQRTEAEVRLRVEQLQNALLGAVSHDLRTPLAGVLGTATTLQRNAQGLTADEYDLLENIRVQTEKMEHTVDRILHMAALQSGQINIKKEWVPLEDLLVIARDQVKTVCTDRPFLKRIPKNLPLLHVDPQLMEQVFSNLLENACKYSPPSSTIELEAYTNDTEITVCIIDHGFGVPSGREEEIFTRFSQVKPPVGLGGSGLGLAICAAIIDLHCGRIWVRNRVVVRGAVFCFAVPREIEPPMPSEGD